MGNRPGAENFHATRKKLKANCKSRHVKGQRRCHPATLSRAPGEGLLAPPTARPAASPAASPRHGARCASAKSLLEEPQARGKGTGSGQEPPPTPSWRLEQCPRFAHGDEEQPTHEAGVHRAARSHERSGQRPRAGEHHEAHAGV